jgi:2-polyprenyl-3-methyl-5-hydroxy-6-metoxy-1,4-benzoquinol methylase
MVIEHVPRVNPFIKHIKKISKRGSYCIILTINTDSLLYKISNFLYFLNIKTPFIRLYDPHHLNHFSRKSLEKVFKKNGFKIIKRIKTPITMKQIDYPYNNILMKYFLYLGLAIILKMEALFNKSWLQTVIFQRKT